MPTFQRTFLRKKTLQLEKTLSEQRQILESQMLQIEAKVRRRTHPAGDNSKMKMSCHEASTQEILRKTKTTVRRFSKSSSKGGSPLKRMSTKTAK